MADGNGMAAIGAGAEIEPRFVKRCTSRHREHRTNSYAHSNKLPLAGAHKMTREQDHKSAYSSMSSCTDRSVSLQASKPVQR